MPRHLAPNRPLLWERLRHPHQGSRRGTLCPSPGHPPRSQPLVPHHLRRGPFFGSPRLASSFSRQLPCLHLSWAPALALRHLSGAFRPRLAFSFFFQRPQHRRVSPSVGDTLLSLRAPYKTPRLTLPGVLHSSRITPRCTVIPLRHASKRTVRILAVSGHLANRAGFPHKPFHPSL